MFTARNAVREAGARYKPHQPELTLLYQNEADTSLAKKRGMTWAQRLKQVFHIDIEQCERCGKQMKVIACIEDPAVIKQILNHLNDKKTDTIKYVIPEGRSPPQSSLFSE